jgi:tetrathionate reductase subunit A
MTNSRRTVLKAGGAAGALALFAAGYSETAAKLVKGAWAGDKPAHKLFGDAPEPEFRIDNGVLSVNPAQQVSYTMCMGCTTYCGVRVRIDKASGKVLRVAGNPYSPLSADPFLPFDTPVRQSFQAVAREQGQTYRSTACGRGNAVLEQMDSPFRILQPMKRVGPRGSGQWQPIAFDQLVKELTEGGDLFGEGPVEGLKALRDLTTAIDPQRPELGPKVNQVAMILATDDGREAFVRRFMQQAYGTQNVVGHGAYCGGAYRSGSGAMFGNVKTMPHAKPDWHNAEFVIFMGTAPANAGNPFKRQGTLLAAARSTGKLNYVVVDPVLNNSETMAVRDRARWVPIKPGTDGALAMAMIRWMIENERYDAKYLAQPNAKAAEAAGEAGFSNATHLVVVEEDHPRNGRLLRGSDMGLALPEADRYGDKDPFVVIDPASGQPVIADQATGPAELFHDAPVVTPAGPLAVRTSLGLLRESALRLTLDQYSSDCGVPVETIVHLARELTSHGKKACVSAHGGMMAGNGFYNAFAVVMLNTLLGNLNWKGGTLAGGGRFPADKGRYVLDTFEGEVKPKGVPLGRNVPYEKTSEFAAKKAAGAPYPAEAPWFPNAPGLATEWLGTMASGYPYPVKALLLWSSNPLYGIPGAQQHAATLKDPKKLPLLVAIDPFLNETSALADYVIPDALMYESWGFAGAWAGVATRMTTARWPVVEPKASTGMESLFIALAKAMGLPGFGANAIADAQGTKHPLDRPEDYYLRAAANIALGGKQPVADASDDDVALSGVARLVPALQAILQADEWRKAAAIFAKGGRTQPQAQTYDGDKAANPFKGMMMVYNEAIGTAKSAITGKRFAGTPTWTPPAFADGTPVRKLYPESDWPFQVISFKSPLQNSYSIGAAALRRLQRENPVIVHVDDAARLGIANGDKIRLTTPGGSVVATALVRHGVRPGVVAVEHGWGHKELGARSHTVGGIRQPERPELAAGVNLNDLGLVDPTRKDHGVFTDPVSGTSVRQGLPAKLQRVASA